MNNIELKKLAEKLEQLENKLLTDWFLDKQTGGYVIAEMFNYDDDIIDISVSSGILGSDEDEGIFEMKMNRKTFEIID